MDRRKFIVCSGLGVATLSGCLNQEQGNTTDTRTDNQTDNELDPETDNQTDNELDPETDNQTDNQTGQGNNTQNNTMEKTDQRLILVNMDDVQHSLQVTVSADDKDIFDQSTDLAADERQQFPLKVDEPGKYTISVTIDENAPETQSIPFDDYDIRAEVDVFVEIEDGQVNIYWQE